MADVIFTKGVEVVTIKPYTFNYGKPIDSGVLTGRTAGNDLFEYQLVVSGKQEFDLRFRALTETERDDLVTFFENRKAAFESFTFTDVDATAYTVKFTDRVLDPREQQLDSWEVAVRMLEV